MPGQTYQFHNHSLYCRQPVSSSPNGPESVRIVLPFKDKFKVDRLQIIVVAKKYIYVS